MLSEVVPDCAPEIIAVPTAQLGVTANEPNWQTVCEFTPVGAAALWLVVIVNVVGVGLVQPNWFTQLNVNALVPVTSVVITNCAYVLAVLLTMITPAVAEPLTPPVAVLALALVAVDEIKQSVNTVREEPWQIDTDPDVPPSVTPFVFTAVKLARFGRGVIVVVTVVVELSQVGVTHFRVYV